MSYQPGPDDVRCGNVACGEWYHKALRSCPMCDTPNEVKPSLRQPVLPAPLSAYEHPAAPFTDRHTRRTVVVVGSVCCLVLLAWAVARILVIREEQRQLREIMGATSQMLRETSKAFDKSAATPMPSSDSRGF